jgi:RES domain-containing protein
MLEYFVHVDKDDPPIDLVLAMADIPDDLSRERLSAAQLPSNWRDPVAPPELAQYGDRFVQRGENCLLLIPSVLCPGENNWLINPAHAQYRKIAIRDLEPLDYDPRMFPRPRRHPRRAR